MNPSLELGPILRSLRHHKGTFSLLVLEVALGFVMLLHTLLIARYYFDLHVRPNGMPEDELVVARRRFLHPRDAAAARRRCARIWRRSAAPARRWRRSTRRRSRTRRVSRSRSRGPATRASSSAGRCARRLVSQQRSACRSSPEPASTRGRRRPTPTARRRLLTRDRRPRRLFGIAGDAVGKDVNGSSFGRGRVVGVVRDFAVPAAGCPPTSIVVVGGEDRSPNRAPVRTCARPAGRRASVIGGAPALAGTADADSTIVIGLLERARRASAIDLEGAVIIALWTGFLVVAVALAGSLALASFSVAERTRQIGVRRALGASRGEIVRYFLLENLILTGFGLALGLGLAVA